MEVVARYQDRLAFSGMEPDLRRHGMAKGLSVGLVQDLHYAIVQFTDCERAGQEFVSSGRWLGEEVEEFVNLCKRKRISCAQRERMSRVSSDTLETVKNEFLKVRDLFALGKGSSGQQGLLTLSEQAFQDRKST